MDRKITENIFLALRLILLIVKLDRGKELDGQDWIDERRKEAGLLMDVCKRAQLLCKITKSRVAMSITE